ncbi:ABC transporter permease [Anaerosporobacter sp.]|uniref:ABC transporter permease n=1 Tax=Anaerosporobacter sp. TaxID=1872529 RepID=UPI00286FAB39|nr:ABC transporter permease [Anaerosporobacter sp.]
MEQNNSKPAIRKQKTAKDNKALYTVISILVGFAIGAIMLILVKVSPFEAYQLLFKSVFGSPKNIAQSIVYATPLILTGLSVAFSFRTGIFNIGAEGQFVMGSVGAMVVGVSVKAPAFIHIPLCLLAAALAGALWGALVGYLKAKLGANEVLCMIMFNWIAYYFSNYVVKSKLFNDTGKQVSKKVEETARLSLSSLKASLGQKVNWGIIVAVIAVIVIYLIINKTTLGYRLRAVGFNRNAAEYAGINVKVAIVTAIAISGALAGLAGATQVLGYNYSISEFAGQEGYGFEGITVAMIGATHPIGVLFAGLFYGAMKFGGKSMNLVGAPTEVIDIIMGSIIFFIAISSILKKLKIGFNKKGGTK